MRSFPFLVLIGLLISNNLLAQTTISSVIVDGQTHKPISYAAVGLKSASDSTFVQGEITNSAGNFEFTNVKLTRGIIEVLCIGYENRTINFSTSTGDGLIVPDTIKLKEKSIGIEEVTVSAGKEIVELADRTIYNISEEMRTFTSSALDILKQIPMVHYDPVNKLSVEGSNNVGILVDGKQRSMNFLEQLQSDDIQSVELINNPLKYGAEYVGVINVKLKKNNLNNIKGNVLTNIPLQKNACIDGKSIAGLELGIKNFRIYLGGQAHYTKAPLEFTKLQNIYSSNSDTAYINSTGTGDFFQPKYELNCGVDYFINKKNYLNIHLDFAQEKEISDLEILYNYQKAELANFDAGISSKNSVYKAGNNYNLFYKHSFNEYGHELTYEVDYFDNGNSKNIVENKTTLLDSDETSIENQTTNLARSSILSNLNYTVPVSSSYSLEFGYTFYSQDMKNKFIRNDTHRPDFNYSETRNAVFSQLMFKKNHLSIMLGLKAEFSSIQTNDSLKNNYFTPIPMFNAVYKITPKQNVKLNLTRRLAYPKNRQLDPFVNTNDNFDIFRGNPYLIPSITDRLRLSYTYQKNKNINLVPSVYYSIKKGIITSYSTINSSSVKETYPENLLNGREMGCGLNAKIFYFRPSITYFEMNVEELSTNDIHIKGYQRNGIRSKLMIAVPIARKAAVFYTVSYTSPVKRGQKETTTQGIQLLGFQVPIKKYNLDVQSFVFMPFYKKWDKSQETIHARHLYEENSKALVTNGGIFMVQISYNFNQKLKLKSINREKSLDSD